MNWVFAGISSATPFISASKDYVEFIQMLFSYVSSLAGGEHRRQLQNELDRLERCMLTLPDLISQAEWFVHRDAVAQLLHRLKDQMNDASDLLEDFHQLRVTAQGATNQLPTNAAAGPFKKFSSDQVKQIRESIESLEHDLEKFIDRRTEVKRFDKCIRPDMDDVCDESPFLGRETEVEEVIRLLGVPAQVQPDIVPSSSSQTKRPTDDSGAGASDAKRTKTTKITPANQLSGSVRITEPANFQSGGQRASNLFVLAIVGIGGIGKTTLAQKVFNDKRVHDYFDLRIWISVSNDFDVLRLSKEFAQRVLENDLQSDRLSSLQSSLTEGVSSKKFLLVLDDVWDDVYMHHDNRWGKFLKPFRNGQQGTMVLLTTRSKKVAEEVNRNEAFALEGLPDNIFRELFKDCAFGTDRLQYSQELYDIGSGMIPHLNGCPLAAKTLGRLLRCMLNKESWNAIAGSELWRLHQEYDDILPVLRLSYQYLPHLHRSCFSFCSMYPKGYQFDADTLIEQWTAAGLLDPRKAEPEGHQCFNTLLNRSLFHKAPASPKYVMHDLMHDMAQLVSGNECFIIKSKDDLKKIPNNVRHLSIIESSGLDATTWRDLCQYKKLRSLVCHGIPSDIITPAAEYWFRELTNIRILSFISCKLDHLPKNIGNLKHLRYLNISDCTLETLPKSFWGLYKLQTVNAQNCTFNHTTEDFYRLESLRKFRLRESTITREPRLVA